MNIIAFAFAITSLILFLIMVPISYSLIGVWLSELGLWLSWIPFGMSTYAIYLIITDYAQLVINLDLSLFAVSIIFNTVTYIRLIIPLIKFRAANKKLALKMREHLGFDYLHYIQSANCVNFFSCVRYRMFYYLTSIRTRTLDKRIKSIKDLVYFKVNNKELKLNIYHPKEFGSYPVICFIHGGGWVIGSKDKKAHERICKVLANMGYCVFNINYRLLPWQAFINRKSDEKELPSMADLLIDVTAGIDFARENAQNYNGNPDTLFVFGRSAGAHLALLSAFVAKDKSKISGVVAFYPVTNFKSFLQFMQKQHRLKMNILNKKLFESEEMKKAFELLSPTNYVNKETADELPPVFLATGKRDKLVDPEQSMILFSKLKQYKVPSVLLELPWANHAFDLILSGPGGQLVFKYLTQFLAWVLAKKQIEKIEAIAKKHGLASIVSKEKIARLNDLLFDGPITSSGFNILSKKGKYEQKDKTK